jgi:hypothetical protein
MATPELRIMPGQRRRRKTTQPTVLVPIKMTVEQRMRFRMLAAQFDTTYADLLEQLMDFYEETSANQRRRQAHPLHRPDGADDGRMLR